MIYRIKQLASETGVKENTLRAAVKRGVIEAPKGRLDIFAAKNREYITRRAPEFYAGKIEFHAEPTLSLDTLPRENPEPIELLEVDNEATKKEQARGENFKAVFKEQALKEEKLEWDIKVKIQDEELKKQRAEFNRVQRLKLRGELLPKDWVIATNSEAVGMYKKMVRQTARGITRRVMDDYKVPHDRRAEYETLFDTDLEALEARYEAKLREVVNSYAIEEGNG